MDVEWDSLQAMLECPFCGGRLELEGEPGGGMLRCRCSAYPIVAGIPYLRSGPGADEVLGLLLSGETQRALCALLGIDEDQWPALEAAPTFRAALALLCEGTEADYLFFRFSDPVFVVGDALLRAVSQDSRCLSRRILDLGGGAGHLTRTACGVAGEGEVVLADISFWQLWLARRFVAPHCQPVCCDANVPLPFTKDAFSLVLCSDAFHYVHSRRGLALEWMRLVGQAGAILLSHLHNSLSWNYSEGEPLSPAGYRRLFDCDGTRLFPESALFNAVVERAPIDLRRRYSDFELADEQVLTLLYSPWEDLFRSYEQRRDGSNAELSVNPLYEVEHDGASRVLKLRFPSEFYELEYESAKRYLPEQVVIGPDDDLANLVQRRVLLDLPEGYA